MMKRLSKIALLAAASAFMLAVFPACGGEESDPEPSVKIDGGNSVTVGGTPLELTAVVNDFPEGEVDYEWTSSATDKATVMKKADDPSTATVTAVAEGEATITVTATAGETVKTATVKVTVKLEDSTDPNPDDNKGATATITFLSGDYSNSSTKPAEEGFFNGVKDGSLAVTVSAVELQLYKSGIGWTAIDATVSSTKAAGSTNANMGGDAGAPASVQAQLTTKNDAVSNANTEVFGEGGYEMGRIKLSVTTDVSAVTLKKISGYFGSGKSFMKGYVKVGDNEYVAITGTTALGSKGFSVKDFEVNQTIPASSTKDVYILLGKTAASAPSAGTTIDVAKLVYEFAAADN